MSYYPYTSSSGLIDVIYAVCDFFEEMHISLREAIFSILIIGVLVTVGFFAANSIEKRVLDEQLIYRQAAQISSPEEFKHAMMTDIGMALVEGDLHAVDPVSYEKLNGTWLKIVADYQKYTMHTRVVTYSDGKRTHTRVETYWTWDTYKIEKVCAKNVNFCGSEFVTEEFDYDMVKRHFKTVDNGYHHRIVFACIPKDFHATIASRLYDNSIHDKPALFEGYDLAKAYEYYTTSHAVCIFWICWIIFIILVCMVFYHYENEWLED